MSASSPSESVKVIVRYRPMNSREIAMKCKSIIQLNSERCSCSLLNPHDYSAPPKVFTFDGIYGENSTTEQIYNEIAYPLIEGILDGYNSTIFAYGQTGCGKSFSMQGVQELDCQRGIIPRAFEHIFEAISLADDYKYLVLASYLEIYNEEIRDLLGSNAKKKLELKENPDVGVYVNDLSYHAVHNVTECQKFMDQGWRNRAIGATMMNADSSRSHSIFTISVEMMPISSSLVHCCATIRRGKLNLVDLAGSERQAKTGATGDRLKEATKINLSLSALGNVISALVDGKAKHIPYRDSKLTRLLQDSLGGNTKTLMVACLSPADYNYDETLSTLRYANRAKNICNQPHINEDPKDTMLREYQEEIQKLRKLVESGRFTQETEASIQNCSNGRYVEYEKEMQKLRKQCEEEYISKCRVQADLLSLKTRYEEEVANLNKLSSQNTPLDSEINHTNFNDEQKINAAQLEIVKRLQKLQSSMVGGERVNDRELKEKRLRKKKAAEQRLNALAKVLAKVEDDEGPNLVLKVYDDIQEELKAKTDLLRKYKQKVRALDRDNEDIQYEFENERTDYLETIRRQERQLKLKDQILNNILPGLSKECNYSNIEKIKEEAKWCEETQSWQVPELINPRIIFPPTASGVNTFQQSHKTAPAKLENSDTGSALWSHDISTSSSEIIVNTSTTDVQVCCTLAFACCSRIIINVFCTGVTCLRATFHAHYNTNYLRMCELTRTCDVVKRVPHKFGGSVSDGFPNNYYEEQTPFSGWSSFSDDRWSGRSSENNTSSSPDITVHRKNSFDQGYQKLDSENFAGSYFKPRRAAELLVQARENANKSSVNGWKVAVQKCKLQPKFRDFMTSEVHTSLCKSKHLLNAQNCENNSRSRSWTGQTSPLTWMTGNVRVSPDMLPNKSNKIDLLPLIREKRSSFERI